ncbi:DVU_1556 family methyltransferase [Geobacter argillaceus]|nr:class I SAM-dependent methyltransferase [Geobacter argillaceus]
MNDTTFNWSEIGRVVGPCIRPGGPVLTERALEICDLPAGSLVADIGCGAGGTLQHLERTGHYRLVGLDHSETLLSEAATRLETARFIRGRAETIPFGSDTFDLLLCECVLSILDDRSAALDEFARVVKGGGYLVLSDLFGKGDHGTAGQADGLLLQQELLDSLSARGFTPLLWEAHDRLLKEFAVRMILAGECLPDSWGCCQRQKGEKTDRSGISYFLLVARKSGATFT